MESTAIESGVEPVAREQEFRRRWFEAHRDRFVADQASYKQSINEIEGFQASAPEALGLLADLRLTGDLDAFIKQMQVWAVKPGTLSFNWGANIC